MTEITTILLAVRKGKDLQKVLEDLGITGTVPKEFLEFTDNKVEFKWFNEKLEYLLKDFELFINNYQDKGFATEDMDLEKFEKIFWERLDQMDEMIKNIRENAKNDIIVLFYGDPGHTSFYYTKPQLYSKAEIFEIFKSNNRNLIKSIIVNGIIDDLKFTEDEMMVLSANLKIPLKDLIFLSENEKYPEEEIDFSESFYKIFGANYIDALIDSIVIEKGNSKYLSRSVIDNFEFSFNPKYYSSTAREYPDLITTGMVLKKVRNSLKDLRFEDDEKGDLFSQTVNTIYHILGNDDLLCFLVTTNFLKTIYENANYYISDPYYIVFAITEGLASKNAKNITYAGKIHIIMMEILKSKILSDLRHEEAMEKFIHDLIRAYLISKNDNVMLFILSILPKNIILEFLNSEKQFVRNLFHNLCKKLNI